MFYKFCDKEDDFSVTLILDQCFLEKEFWLSSSLFSFSFLKSHVGKCYANPLFVCFLHSSSDSREVPTQVSDVRNLSHKTCIPLNRSLAERKLKVKLSSFLSFLVSCSSCHTHFTYIFSFFVIFCSLWVSLSHLVQQSVSNIIFFHLLVKSLEPVRNIAGNTAAVIYFLCMT